MGTNGNSEDDQVENLNHAEVIVCAMSDEDGASSPQSTASSEKVEGNGSDVDEAMSENESVAST